MSGATIVPVAYASSRRRIFEKAWDKAALNLPFGRAAFCIGEPDRRSTPMPTTRSWRSAAPRVQDDHSTRPPTKPIPMWTAGT
jgi:hypothetical protein